jgi:hypothetical protein
MFRYAQEVHQGNFDDKPVIKDLITAMHELKDRERRGVGRQNFRFGTVLDRFAQEVFTLNPKLYRVMSKVLPLRSESSSR